MLNPFEYDFGGLTGPHFYSLCYRVAAYDGVMAQVAAKQAEDQRKNYEFENPTIEVDSSGRRVKGMSGVDFLKKKQQPKEPDLLSTLAKQGVVEIQQRRTYK